MDDPTSFITNFTFFAFGILALCYVVRVGAETVAKTLSKTTAPSTAQMIWENFVLKTLPILTGGGLGWIVSSFPYPASMGTSAVARIFYGSMAGFCSGWMYQVGKAVIYSKWNVPLPAEAGQAPASPTDQPPTTPTS